jgi:hypothetical protein
MLHTLVEVADFLFETTLSPWLTHLEGRSRFCQLITAAECLVHHLDPALWLVYPKHQRLELVKLLSLEQLRVQLMLL